MGYAGSTLTYAEDLVENLLSHIRNELRLEEYFIKLQVCRHDTLTLYPLKVFEDRTPSGGYNEILIRGDATPSAVFVFKDRFEELKDRVLIWSCAMALPVVIYDREADEVQCIDRFQVECNTAIVGGFR